MAFISPLRTAEPSFTVFSGARQLDQLLLHLERLSGLSAGRYTWKNLIACIFMEISVVTLFLNKYCQ